MRYKLEEIPFTGYGRTTLCNGESIPLAIGSPTQLTQPVQRAEAEEARKIQDKIAAGGERRQAVMEPQRTLGPNWHRLAEALRSATSPYADWSIGHRNRSVRGTEKAGRA
ncbi:hypothetical protein T01_10871 [Trichinella spiralis]|uniref:Uncharacterized protein n=1 Tax=Trichinella spiralis TaxID=6334 RepID=A0A0V1B9U9_TRISP|nr:hypothetical protein T01_10871 [Trichinella spiralis]